MIVALHALILIVVALFLGIASAFTTKFILYLIGDPWDEQVNKKAIFSKIGEWIDKGYHIHETLNPAKRNWFMALGACYYCLNVYVSFAVSFAILWHLDLTLWLLIVCMPVSHFSISKIMD